MAAESDRTLDFGQVLVEELASIDRRRRGSYAEEKGPAAVAPALIPPDGAAAAERVGVDRRLRDARGEALRKHLVGVAFSGGGIRSATFAVGVLQGLAKLGLLRRIDYLSTVSGGGYAGSWLAAWIKREGSVTNVEKQLATSRVVNSKADRGGLLKKGGEAGRAEGDVVDEEPEPIYHLRAYSRFLAPRSGLLTADTWSLITTYLRNLAINLAMLLPAALAVVFALRLAVWFCGLSYDFRESEGIVTTVVSLVLGLVAFWVAFALNARGVNYIRSVQEGGGGRPPFNAAHFVAGIVVPMVVGVFFLARVNLAVDRNIWRWMTKDLPVDPGHIPIDSRHLWLLRGSLALGSAVSFGGLLALIYFFESLRYPSAKRGWLLGSSFLSGFAGGAFLSVILILALRTGLLPGRPDLVATYATPLGLLAVVAATVVHVGHLGRDIGEIEREWWARLDAWLVIAAIAWVAIFEVVLYLPAAVVWIGEDYIGPGVIGGLVTSWLGTTVAGVLAGSSARTGQPDGSATLEAVAAVAPPIFLIGLFGGLGALAYVLVDGPLPGPGPGRGSEALFEYYMKINSPGFPALAAWAAGLTLLSYFMTRKTEVNLFSLNAMYANRLTRCYLGASRRMSRWADRWGGAGDPREGGGAPTHGTEYELSAPPASRGWVWRHRGAPGPAGRPGASRALRRSYINPNALRQPHPIVGFDLNDDIPLVDLQIGEETGGSAYLGPQLLINTSLNLVAGSELAWSDRKSESFVLTPTHCGSKGTGYARVTRKTRDRLSVGRAIAISGAAVDPNMNYHQSPTLSAFLTVFNARLGYWIENPSLPAEGTSGGELVREVVALWAEAIRPGRGGAGPAAADPVEQARLAGILALSRAADKREHDRAREAARREGEAAVARLERAKDRLKGLEREFDRAAAAAGAAAPQRPGEGFGGPALLALSEALSGVSRELFDLSQNRARIADLRAAIERLNAEARARDLPPAWEHDVGEIGRAVDDLEQALGRVTSMPGEAASGTVSAWRAENPRHGGLLVTELLGGTDGRHKYVHLTDGGHFENTGVYELVRRRCRYIVACDANTDRTAADENLANLVRLVRIDFGIRIEIDTTPLELDGEDTRLCRSHVVVGSVRYDDVDNGQVPGALVYIRTSMTGDEPPDIRNYAAVNREFPYTTSANQFFDESQFESYRALGEHVARIVFEDAKADAERLKKLWEEGNYNAEFRRGNKRLFAAVRRRWAESMPGQDTRFLESARGYSEIQQTLRSDAALDALSLEVYPELGPATPTVPAAGAAGAGAAAPARGGRRAELYAVAQMLQAMENAWIGLDLKSHPEAPISHGWWSVFRRWTSTPSFHRNWPILRPEFSTEFARFVETRLGLVPAMPEIAAWPKDTEAEHLALIEEFDREWPVAPAPDEGRLALSLNEMIGAKVPGRGKRPAAAWAIRQRPLPDLGGGASASDLRGIILLFQGSSLYPQPAAPTDYELLVWIRRSHRGIGLATYGMEQKEVEDRLRELKARGKVYVRYPRVDDDVIRSMWKR
ncbi:MAG TPA: patatin-like phospholipase family protein, partial [Isosphaeraceae bacterium]